MSYTEFEINHLFFTQCFNKALAGVLDKVCLAVYRESRDAFLIYYYLIFGSHVATVCKNNPSDVSFVTAVNHMIYIGNKLLENFMNHDTKNEEEVKFMVRRRGYEDCLRAYLHCAPTQAALRKDHIKDLHGFIDYDPRFTIRVPMGFVNFDGLGYLDHKVSINQKNEIELRIFLPPAKVVVHDNALPRYFIKEDVFQQVKLYLEFACKYKAIKMFQQKLHVPDTALPMEALDQNDYILAGNNDF